MYVVLLLLLVQLTRISGTGTTSSNSRLSLRRSLSDDNDKHKHNHKNKNKKGDVDNNGNSNSDSSNNNNNNSAAAATDKNNNKGRGVVRDNFGLDADWSCTSKGANDYDTCVTEHDNDDNDAPICAWCPLGSDTHGICLQSLQGEIINGFQNEHLLHLKCYNNYIEAKNTKTNANTSKEHTDIVVATKFWNESTLCSKHNSGSCAGDHHGPNDHNDHHVCTWCTVLEPQLGFCISQNVWDNIVVAQALEEFDYDVSTNNQIRLDQVIHCDNGNTGNDGANDSTTNVQNSLWDTTACLSLSLDDCVSTKKDDDDDDDDNDDNCVVQTNPFPGLFGYGPGDYCVSIQQQRLLLWMVQLLNDMKGWKEEEQQQQEM